MKIKRKIIIGFVVCMLLGLVACNKKEEASMVKVKVNGQEITVGEYDKRLAQMMEMYEAQYGSGIWTQEVEKDKTYKQYLEDMVLDTMILEIVIIEEANKAGLKVTDEEMKEEFAKYKEYFTSEDEYNKFLKESGMTEDFLKESLKKELLIDQFLSIKSEAINSLDPSDAELRALYDDKKIMFDQIEASHILVDSEKSAKEIKEKIDKGEDFAQLAKEFSSCPSSEDGGNLGYFTYGDMMTEFSEVAFKLKIGEISDPVKSSYGYHVIKVTDIKDSYEEIEQEELKYQFKTLKYNEMLDNYIENAKIEK